MINLLPSEPFRTSTIISEFSCRFPILQPKTDTFRKSLCLNDGSAFVTQKQSQLEDWDEYQLRTYFIEVQPNELPTSSAKYSISLAVSTLDHQTTDIPNTLNSYQSSRPKPVTSDVILTSNNESPDDIPISLDFPKSPELQLEEEQQEGNLQKSDSEESLKSLHESMDQPDCNSEPQGIFNPSNSSVQSLPTQSSNPRFLLSMGDADTMLDAEDKTLPGDHSLSSAIAKGNLVDSEGRQFNPPGPSVTQHTIDEGHDRLVAVESNKNKSQLTALISSYGDIPKTSITHGRTEINKLITGDNLTAVQANSDDLALIRKPLPK
ncbi:uncharacterized protein FSUBG_13315 [Fusarium subglutinans]|uniref:Uncharacterized protein n=1 Tax=Gibberella subglutinans TaxID=42677 RepID=A0A8H5KYB6_GIBSU|nr:uncharacterized protein FSUBG_13315 [Fusarium subglutinans]KAF5580711.1 hypothetical protein FSUBG_13315 [Fusarium subglutinans]